MRETSPPSGPRARRATRARHDRRNPFCPQPNRVSACRRRSHGAERDREPRPDEAPGHVHGVSPDGVRVIVEEGTVDGGISERLSAEDLDKGYRLACQSAVKEDITVRVPVESSVDASALNAKSSPRHTARIRQMDLNDLKEQGLFVPPVEKKYLELPLPTADDHLPDVTRLVSHLKLRHDEYRIMVSLPVIRKIPDILRVDDFNITATLERPVHEGRKTNIINVQPGDTTDRNYAIAVDIGTTTIYGQLIDLITGDVLAENGDFNAQISFGEDVISRITYANEADGGVSILQREVVSEIDRLPFRPRVTPPSSR